MCVILAVWTALSKCSRCLDVRRYILCKILLIISVKECVNQRNRYGKCVRLKLYVSRVISPDDVIKSGCVKSGNFKIVGGNVIVVNNIIKFKRRRVIRPDYAKCDFNIKRVKTNNMFKYCNSIVIRTTRNNYLIFKYLEGCVIPTGGSRNIDLSRVILTCGRAYFCVCSFRIGIEARDSYIISLFPLFSSTDFIFNFSASQLNIIDCNFINLISIIFIFNYKHFRQLCSINTAVCVQYSLNKLSFWKSFIGFEMIKIRSEVIKCRNELLKLFSIVNVLRALKYRPMPYRFPIVISKICFTVISYYYNLIIIIKNVIPIIVKFITTVIDMPFYLIIYPLSGFGSSINVNSEFSRQRLYLL